jgi:hypothetical protein
MNDNTSFTIVFSLLIIGFFGVAAFGISRTNDVKIACYEAMKVNPNLICDSSVRITK